MIKKQILGENCDILEGIYPNQDNSPENIHKSEQK
jgi:hypothetical protein